MAGEERLGRALLELSTEDSGLDRGVAKARQSARGLQEDFDRSSRSIRETFKETGRSMERFGENTMRVGATLSAAFTVPLAGVINAAGTFEQSMNKVRAVSGATGADFEALNAQARALGESTSFSASQAADGMSFLAMAGFDANQIVGAMPGTLSLAAAGQMDLARTADIASNILTGFKIPAEDMNRVADVMAKAMSSANTNIEQLGEGMKFVAPLASAAGVSLETTTAAIGLLSNAGIQGSMAGTSLRRAFAELLDPGKELSALLFETGIQTRDSAGQMRPFADIIDELGEASIDAGRLMAAFGQRAGPAMIELVTQGGGALREFTGELENAGGTADRIANVQLEGLKGSWVIMKSALEGLAIAIASAGILEFGTEMVQLATETIRWFTALPAPIQKFGAVLLTTLGVGGPVLLAIGAMSKGIGLLIAGTGPIGLFIAAAGLLTAAWAAFGDDIKRVLGGSMDWVHTRFTQAHDWIVGTFTVTKDKVIELWTALVEGIKTIILGPFTAVTDTVKNAWKSITDGAAAMYQRIVGGSIIPDMVMEVETWFDRMTANTGNSMEAMRQNTERSAHSQLVDSTQSFGQLFGMFSAFSTDMFKMSQIAGAGQAFVAALVGAAEALKLGWPLGVIAAAKVLATGMGFVASIKSASMGGGGGASVSASTGGVARASTTAQPAETSSRAADATKIDITVRKQSRRKFWSDEEVAEMFESFNEALQDGNAQVRRFKLA